MKIYSKSSVNLLLILTVALTLETTDGLLNVKEIDKDLMKRYWPYDSHEITLDPKMARMSSIYDDASTADRAVWGSCNERDNWNWASATMKEKNPGWKIDLKLFYFVKSFVVTAHKYSYGAKRFKNAYAFILADEQNLVDNDMDFAKACYTFNGPAEALEEVVFPCETFGRFVSIVLMQNAVWLEICHVSVYGTSSPEVQLDPNMAWQSSTSDKLSVASYAVTKMRSCSETGENWASSTDKQKNPAWAIDLKVVHKIEIVVVTARNDQKSDKYERFYSAYSLASHQRPNLDNIDFNKHCYLFYGPAVRLQNVIFYCKSFGRYLTIALQQANQYLEMCHLMIYSSPLDGQWSNWSHWSRCSVTCEAGTAKRSRRCDNPTPKSDGQDCTGSGNETKSCNKGMCPIDGKWTIWSPWGHCTSSCDYSVKRRSRVCSNPAPQHGGKQCRGHTREIVQCDTLPCTIDGGWSPWGVWSKCSQTCGLGILQRTRSCSFPSPQYGGAECGGLPVQVAPCTSYLCW